MNVPTSNTVSPLSSGSGVFPDAYAKITWILTAPLRFSIFKGGLFKPRLDALLGNPHTPSNLETNRYNALEPTFYIFFIAMVLLLQLLRWQ
jgi:hypothetical protein